MIPQLRQIYDKHGNEPFKDEETLANYLEGHIDLKKGLLIGGIVLAGGGLIVGGGALAATAAGFGAEGIVAGSAAAAWQASMGTVAAGSLFATLQSLGAAGTLVAITAGSAAVVGGGVGVAIASNAVPEEQRCPRL